MGQPQRSWFDQQAASPEAQSWFAAQEGGPPSPSVMDERGILDRAVDHLPAVGGTLGGIFGGKKTLTGAAASGGGAILGEGARQLIRLAQGRGEEVPDTPTDSLLRMAKIGGLNAAQEAGGRILIDGLTQIPRKIMNAATGAQKALRQKYPTIDIDEVAIREGAVMGSPRSTARIRGESTAANAAIQPAGKAAEVQGKNVVEADVLGDLQALRDRFVRARMPDKVAALDDYIAEIKAQYQGGIPTSDALIRNQELQATASSALPSSPDPRRAGIEKRAAGAESKGVTRTLHDPQRSPGVGPTLERAQEMKALKQAMENVPRPRLASVTDAPLYALRRTAASPPMLSRYAIAADRMGQMAQTPLGASGRIPDEMVRRLLEELLIGQEQEP